MQTRRPATGRISFVVDPEYHALLKKMAHKYELTQAGLFVVALKVAARRESATLVQKYVEEEYRKADG